MEPMEDDRNLATMADLLAAQARDLHRVFTHAFQEMLLGRTRSFRDVGRALKAQNQCRIALGVLVALRAAEEARKKSRNRTNELLKRENYDHGQDLGRALSEPRSCPDNAYAQDLAAQVPEKAGPVHRERRPCRPRRRGNPAVKN